MGETIQETKSALRDQAAQLVKGIPAAERAAVSAQARALLAEQALWRKAETVLFFAPLPGELDVWPLLSLALSEGKRAALPLFDRHQEHYTACMIQDPDTDLHVGHFGIREPNTYCSRLTSGGVDLILVPGVAFDPHGHRLGRGKGYYDRLLAEMRGTRCGVAFDLQVVPQIPSEEHDATMDYLLTPTRCLEITR